MTSEYTSERIIAKIIEQGIVDNNYERLEGALIASRKYDVHPSLIEKGYNTLGTYHSQNGDMRKAILSFERARSYDNLNFEAVKALLNLILEYWSENKNKFCQDDLLKIQFFINLILDSLLEHPFYHRISKKLSIFRKVISEIKDSINEAPNEKETIHSHFLDTVIQAKYERYTPKERRKEFAKTISKVIKKRLQDRDHSEEPNDKRDQK